MEQLVQNLVWKQGKPAYRAYSHGPDTELMLDRPFDKWVDDDQKRL